MRIGVIGAGTWGMALARLLANKGYDVEVFSVVEKEIEELCKTRTHRNLPEMIIPDSLRFTADKECVCKDKDIILCAVASVYVRSTMELLKDYIKDNQIIVTVTKGIESDTLMTMSEVIEDVLKDKKVKVIALSGPTHAEEVALDMPTTIVSACKEEEVARYVQDVFMDTCLRVYTNDDVLGVELCGALKNIIALAAGISNGLGNGDNARAAIITRGMVEITRLGLAMGAHKDTFAGLAGIGDLIVTATSDHSRNNRCGVMIGKGKDPEEAIDDVGMVVEGINALPAAMKLMKKYNVEMPIISMVNRIVNKQIDPRSAIDALMTREKKQENII